jgi:hypothetical protein
MAREQRLAEMLSRHKVIKANSSLLLLCIRAHETFMNKFPLTSKSSHNLILEQTQADEGISLLFLLARARVLPLPLHAEIDTNFVFFFSSFLALYLVERGVDAEDFSIGPFRSHLP